MSLKYEPASVPLHIIPRCGCGSPSPASTEVCCGTEAGSYLRLINSCITQLKAQGPSRTSNESKDEEDYLDPVADLLVQLLRQLGRDAHRYSCSGTQVRLRVRVLCSTLR